LKKAGKKTSEGESARLGTSASRITQVRIRDEPGKRESAGEEECGDGALRENNKTKSRRETETLID